ncbi:hypothetical protein [Pelagibaculum spongiae]|uniref:Uncharacterized protein n=1 Tax=Pelagibaculum spongiae TaxID=2080658 RepID=A0A2V1GVS0_9GAMM|nr:hypothetical protein [Pelagibaculum spongiae]PVZ70418.1 hypothetical protein DC094_07450 [Pelagibaculum spongiae]
MSQNLVFNHHSLPYQHAAQAKEDIAEFLKIAIRCRTFGYDAILLDEEIDQSWYGLELAKDYFLRDWFVQANQDPQQKDLVRAFRSIATRQPLFDADELKQSTELDAGLAGEDQSSIALLASFYFEAFLLSFPSQKKWTKPELAIWIKKLDEESGEIEQASAELKNIFSIASLSNHELNLKTIRDQKLQTANDILQRRQSLFPCIEFLDSFSSDLRRGGFRADILDKSKDALLVLNQFCDDWKEEKFSEYRHEYLRDSGLNMEVSGESSTVADDPKLRSQREYRLPSGTKVYCENHIKLPAGFRMHFYPDTTNKKIYIAYLGPHLKLK